MRFKGLTKGLVFGSIGFIFVSGVTLEMFRSPEPSQASEATPEIELIHKPPTPQALPQPAFPMPLVIELQNTKATELKIRVIASRDGTFMDVMMNRGFLNEVDRPTYQVEIPAPVGEFSYQFVIHHEDGSMSTSRKYLVRRPCIQSFRVDVPDDHPDADFKKELATLVSRAKQLERDTGNYETALKLIEEMRGLIKE